MKHSTDHILATHVGSLPRPPDLIELLRKRRDGEPIDPVAFAARVKSAVEEVVRRQVEIGFDIVADGEMGRVGFIPYINERLTGFEPIRGANEGNSWSRTRDAKAFPEYYDYAFNQPGTAGAATNTRCACCGPIAYKGQQEFQTDVANLKEALAKAGHDDAFMPAISPANVEQWDPNQFYQTGDAYLEAIAEALRTEYLAVIDAGFTLQIDDPILATWYIQHPEASIEQVRTWAESRVEALNHALRGIPPEKIRYHTCYSINMGPRLHDMEAKYFLDIMLKINAGAYSFEASNPRHEHEWRLWEELKLPEGKILIPGVVTNSSILVEHPELVADRIERFANVVGRENVIAGADCGFASFATTNEMHPTIVWAKLEALVAGAGIASARLWR